MERVEYLSKAEDFYLKEYECLRREIEWLLSDYRSLERNAVIAVGISWAWLFAQRQEIPSWAWYFPCLFAILGSVRALGIMHSFTLFHQYMKFLESWFSSEDTKSSSSKLSGWNHFLDSQNHPPNKRTRTSASRMAGVFWVLLIVSTILVAIFGSMSKASAVPSIGFPRF